MACGRTKRTGLAISLEECSGRPGQVAVVADVAAQVLVRNENARGRCEMSLNDKSTWIDGRTVLGSATWLDGLDQ